jgi:hypothetical protein
MRKLPLVFIEKKTWESWISVFDAWERGELIGEDRKDPTLIPRLSRAHITKTDVAPMLGLHDSDLVLLAKEILENKVCIKTNVAYRDRLTLAQWCKEMKLDCVIMNEFMWKHRQYRLPCKDTKWVPYDDAAWEALCEEKGFTLTIVRNIWKDMMHYTEGANWLAGQGNAMSPSSDKTVNVDKVLQVAPKEFYDAYAKYTSLSLDGPVTVGRKILYECMAAETLEEVIQKLTGPTQVVDLNEAIPRYIIVFGFSAAGDPFSVMRIEVLKVIQASMHTTDCMTFDDKDNDAMSMDVPLQPFPFVWIRSEVLRSVVCSTTLLATFQVAAHSVLYLPPSRSLFKKPILDSAPSVHISVLYPKSGGSKFFFSEWTGIRKLLDPVIRPLDMDEVDYNGGICGLGHRVVEDVMKPTMKKTRILVVNVWGGGNITEAALLSLNPPLLCTPVGWQPIELALNFIVTCITSCSLSIVMHVSFASAILSCRLPADTFN